MNLNELLLQSPALVKELSEGLNCEGLILSDVETRILQFVHQIGQALEKEVCLAVREPTVENRLQVNGEHLDVFSSMPLRRGNELDAAMTMLVVVPPHECLYPTLQLLQGF